MNINILIDQIKKMAGLNGILKDSFPDALIKDSIINNTLQTFNRYSAFYIKMSCDTMFQNWPRKQVNNGADIEIIIPQSFLDTFEELGSDIQSVTMENRSIYPYTTNNLYSRGMRDDLIMYAGSQLNRINSSMPKPQWRAPNTIYIKDWFRGIYQVPLAYTLTLKCTHPKNLSTITKGLEQMFMELAYYDLLINIYNNDFRLMNVTSGAAEVNLSGLDNFSGAESKREELLERIRKKSSYDTITLETL